MDDINPGRLLAEARARSGLSQRALAEGAGTSQSAVARLEGGGVQPSLGTLERLLAVAGFSLRCELAPASVADPPTRPPRLDDSRRAMLAADLALTPTERVLAAERTAREVPMRRCASLFVTFDRFEDYFAWKHRETIGVS